MTTTRMGGFAAVLTLAATAAFGPLQAQTSAVEQNPDAGRADLLAQHGRQLALFERDFRRASSLLRAAAELRGEDALAVDELIEAGHYAYYGGRKTIAVQTLDRAARVALATGDPTTAAESLLDGAWVAHELGDLDTARRLLLEGERVARSSGVAAADRADLLARIRARGL